MGRAHLAIVNLNSQTHRVLIHPILQERILPEFLNPSEHSQPLIKDLHRCQEHLAADRPLVMRAPQSKVYYVVCPLFAAILKRHQWLPVGQKTIPAIEVQLSDDEIVEMFWAKIRSTFSLHKICRQSKISLKNSFDGSSREKTKSRARKEIEHFDSLVDGYREASELATDNTEYKSSQLNLWSLKK